MEQTFFDLQKKAKRIGVENLTDVELLAIFLWNCENGNDVIKTANTIHNDFKSLEILKNLSHNDLVEINGINDTKALEIKSLFELARRISIIQPKELNSAFQVNNFFHSIYDIDLEKEQFIVFLLNPRNELIYFKKMYVGTKHELSIEPKEVISLALKHEAEKLYCFHNHPSGNINPSREDKLITASLTHYAKLFGIELVGHYITNNKKQFLKVDVK